jgi:hypothetical protein
MTGLSLLLEGAILYSHCEVPLEATHVRSHGQVLGCHLGMEESDARTLPCVYNEAAV